METPVFIRKHPAGWLWESVCNDRTTAMSSTQVDRWGKMSETSMPHCPCLANLKGVPT